MIYHVIFLLLEAHGWLLDLLRRPTLRSVAVQDLGVPSVDEPGLEGSSVAQSTSQARSHSLAQSAIVAEYPERILDSSLSHKHCLKIV